MRATRSEQTLRRLFAWLRWSGQELTPELEQAILQTLAEAVEAGAQDLFGVCLCTLQERGLVTRPGPVRVPMISDRKSTRLNSSHVRISYAVFCLKKKRRWSMNSGGVQ